MDRESCQAAWNDGDRPGFVFFWGHTPKVAGVVDHCCFSQWWHAPFTDGVDGGVTYPTTEHWMMAHKARTFGDDDALARVLQAETPAEAKAIGRTVRGFVKETWSEVCFDVVVAGNLAKFSQHKELAAILEATGGKILVEASPVDPIWGIGLAADDPRALDPSTWRGQNLLGFALVEVRERLRQPAT